MRINYITNQPYTKDQINALESLLVNLLHYSDESIKYCFEVCDTLQIGFQAQNKIIAISENKQLVASTNFNTLIESAL